MTNQHGVVIGLKWWGVGPQDMAHAARNAGICAEELPIWNIQKRLHRIVMNSPLESHLGDRRVRGIFRGGRFDWAIVTSPHRLSIRALKIVRQNCRQVIAMLGDKPIGARRLPPEALCYVDLLVVPERDWAEDLPPHDARIIIAGWGSTLCDSELLEADLYDPQSMVLVGAPYPERIELAKALSARYRVTVQGDAWPVLRGVSRRKSLSRLESIRCIREYRELVVNVQHGQFRSGLNPQFYDYAAAGVPQLVLYPSNLTVGKLALKSIGYEIRTAQTDLLTSKILANINVQATELVRREYMFEHILKRSLVQ